MSRTVEEIMTVAPATVGADEPTRAAARVMREHDVGAVLVLDGDGLHGILTDRDLAVRLVAEGHDAESTAVREVATADPTAVDSSDSVDDAISLMRERALRRLPVTEGGRPVGIVSLGDLAVERDADSALADISASDPDR